VIVNRVFVESWSDKTKDYEIGICFFSGKHTLLRSENKYTLEKSEGVIKNGQSRETGNICLTANYCLVKLAVLPGVFASACTK
jgi:hypothetical protein